MEKVLKKMPGADDAPVAKVVLEINHSHPITEKLLNLFATDRDTLAKYSKILYSEACLIGGVSIEDPSELSELITELMTK
jgi:molecular chaperone HtpG